MSEADKSNLSEEEIIKNLNNVLEKWQEIIKMEDKEEREIEMSMYFEEMPFYEIQGLLDLYNKEKLNSSNSSEQLNKEKERNMNLELENIVLKEDRRIAVEETEQKEKKAYIDGTNIAHNLCNKKWEDKIKAKIEEVKDGTFDAKIVLQSLLEKE